MQARQNYSPAYPGLFNSNYRTRLIPLTSNIKIKHRYAWSPNPDIEQTMRLNALLDNAVTLSYLCTTPDQ